MLQDEFDGFLCIYRRHHDVKDMDAPSAEVMVGRRQLTRSQAVNSWRRFMAKSPEWILPEEMLDFYCLVSL